MSEIHPTAIIEDGASIGVDVKIGPYCFIGSNVVLADRINLGSHVVISGLTQIGEGTHIFPFASIGHNPQDLKYKGEPSRLEIGCNNVIREHVTMNPGTQGGGLLTKVGDNCLFMVASHIAHDCTVGDNVILVNNATLGGHVKIGDFAIIGGLAAVHQFVRIGRHSMIGGCSGVENDVIPYGSIVGNRGYLSGLNLVGLKRRGFSRDIIHDLRRAYRLLFSQEGTQAERMADVSELFSDIEPVMEILDFMGVESSRAICQPLLEDAA
ncbi:MAG TPA: acyl-ACP--UDP-N-acetylglucosamine O-acyltransferase [Rhodospirillales bacterium]|jgi:UDP-N-acetylglucosamine acyltransferase|nr:acyl-ACP--UDP-N-acetylglucosamine O-acyltransferase [Rhodospirillales bacterium]